MRTRLWGIAGLALGLTILGGGAASAHGTTAVPLFAASASHGVGAGLSAPLYQLLASTPATQDPACATQDQTQPDGTGTAADTDTVDLQCGDQTGADTGADTGAGAADVDNIQDQSGANDGAPETPGQTGA